MRIKMNEPHPHAQLIKQWADGSEIQYYDERLSDWKATRQPSWSPAVKYRVNPNGRKYKLENNHWYPVKDAQGDCAVMRFDSRWRSLFVYNGENGNTFEEIPDNCQWIGESLGEIAFGDGD